MKKIIFYSWQSDLPNNTNRGFISEALSQAIDELKADKNFKLFPSLDRDTKDLPGSPDIATSIFNKIRNSSVFVCDVSIINKSENQLRATPNPNVLIELGYAIRHLDWENIIMIMNIEYGNVELLPFDLRSHRILTYQLNSESPDKSIEKKKMASILKDNVKNILLGKGSDKSNNTLSNIEKVKHSNNELPITNDEFKLDAILKITSSSERNDTLKNVARNMINKSNFELALKLIDNLTFASMKNDLLEEMVEKCIIFGNAGFAQEAISRISLNFKRDALTKKLVQSI